MFPDGLEEWITEAAVLAPGEAILFFRWQLLKEGLSLGDARDVGFCLASPVNWARREAEVEMMVRTVREGHWAIADTVMEKKTKARGPGQPQGITKTNQIPSAAYNIEEWMQGLEEDVSKVEVRKGDVSNCGTEWRNTFLNVWLEVEDDIEDKVPHDYQETLLLDLPLQGEGVLIGEVNGDPISWPWWGGLERVTKQEGQEEVWGWRSICQSPRMNDQRCCDLPFMAVGQNHFQPLRLGQPKHAAICLLVIIGVPWRPCQEFGQGHYPNWHLTDFVWALWHSDDIQHP